VCGDCLAAADRVHAFVALAFYAHQRSVDGHGACQALAKAIDERRDTRALEDDDHVEAEDVEPRVASQARRATQEIDARRTLPLRIVVWKVAADIAERRRAEHGVGDGVA